MSVQAMSWVIEHAPQRGAAYLMLLFLADEVGDEEFHFYEPSLTRLAEKCRLGEEETAAVFDGLVAAGAVVRAGATPDGALFRIATDGPRRGQRP